MFTHYLLKVLAEVFLDVRPFPHLIAGFPSQLPSFLPVTVPILLHH